MAITIREANNGDYEPASRLVQEVADLHGRSMPPGYFPPSTGPAMPQAEYSDILADPRQKALVAEEDGKVVGYLSSHFTNATEEQWIGPASVAKINCLSVDEQQKGKGIGTKLLSAAEDWAKANGAVAVQLGVYDFNTPARQLYLKEGYMESFCPSRNTIRMEKRFSGPEVF